MYRVYIEDYADHTQLVDKTQAMIAACHLADAIEATQPNDVVCISNDTDFDTDVLGIKALANMLSDYPDDPALIEQSEFRAFNL